MNNYIFYTYLLFIYYYGVFYSGTMHLYLVYITHDGIKGAIYEFTEILPFPIQLIIVIQFLLIDAVLLNTLLVGTATVKNYMFDKYGEEILKQRGYNALTSSMRKFVFTCVASYLYDWRDFLIMGHIRKI